MNNQTFGVIGLGNFGYYIARDLILDGRKVIIADKNDEAFKELKDLNENSFIIDSTDKNALKEAGFGEVDTVIVSIGENIESSILTFMALKELNVKTIIAKAINQTHGKILSKLGVSKVIYPERDTANKLIKELLVSQDFEMVYVTNSLKVAKILVGDVLSGLSVDEVSKRSNTMVTAIKHSNSWVINPPLDMVCYQGDVLVVFGKSEFIESFVH